MRALMRAEKLPLMPALMRTEKMIALSGSRRMVCKIFAQELQKSLHIHHHRLIYPDRLLDGDRLQLLHHTCHRLRRR